MRIYEKVVIAILLVTIPAELIVVAGIDGTAGAWAWWVLLSCAFLQVTAMALIKIGATAAGEKCTLFWKRKNMTCREMLERSLL